MERAELTHGDAHVTREMRSFRLAVSRELGLEMLPGGWVLSLDLGCGLGVSSREEKQVQYSQDRNQLCRCCGGTQHHLGHIWVFF